MTDTFLEGGQAFVCVGHVNATGRESKVVEFRCWIPGWFIVEVEAEAARLLGKLNKRTTTWRDKDLADGDERWFDMDFGDDILFERW